MKRKLLLTALCVASVTTCAFGLTACGDKTPEEPTHSHSWGAWTVTDANKPSETDEGKATRTCSGTGDCNGSATDKEYTLPALTSADYTKTDNTATCSAAGKIIYSYNKNNVSVSFDIATPVNGDAHNYGGWQNDSADGHYKVCSLNGTHKTTPVAHDENGTDGACSVCGYKPATNPPVTHTHTPGEWVKTDATGHYKLCTDANCDNPTEKIQPGSHDENGTDGACSVCGYKAPEENPPVVTPSEPDAELSSAKTNATVKVGGGKSANINAYAMGNGYYTFTYEGDDPITVSYKYNDLATGEITGSATLSWEGTRTFTVRLSTKATCWITVTSDKATEFNARLDMSFSETDPTPAPKLNLNSATEVNATFEGKRYEFTATAAGSFSLACTDNKAVIYLATDDENALTLPYTFTLAANETITFLMSCGRDDGTATYNVSLTEVIEHSHTWGDWEVTNENKPTATAEGKATRTCSGTGDCNAAASDKEYVLPALDSTDYTITNNTATVDGAGTATYSYNKNGVTVSFTAATPAIDSQNYEITVTGAGEGVTVKLGKYSDTTNAQGVATVKAEKQDYDVVIENSSYSYTAGKVTAANPSATFELPTSIGGGSATSPASVGEGIYVTTITSVEDGEIAGTYTARELYFAAGGSGAKTYTVKILSENTTISPVASGYTLIDSVGESYSIVLEDGERSAFNIVSNDEEISATYSYKVVFEISISDAPAAGCSDRPIRLEKGTENTAQVESGTDGKVYYRVDYETFGKYATLTFGEGVTVYSLGLNKTGNGTQISSGDYVTIGEHAPAYLYAVSMGASVALTANVHYIDGMKQQPINVTVGAENSPAFNTDSEKGDMVYEQWYKLQVTADGTYIIKPDAAHAVLDVYTDVDGAPVNTASGGAAVVIKLTANSPVYIKATSSLNTTYKFTATALSENDKGASKEEPLELTASGDYPIYAKHYYKFTPAESCKVVISYNDGVESTSDKLIIYVHSDATYDNTKTIVTSGAMSNKVEFFAVAGETYYFHTDGGAEAKQPTFKFEMTALEAHDHVISLTGAENAANVSVKVMDGTTEIANGTTNANGAATLSFVPGNYKIVLENLPTGYGYFANYALTEINNDETSNVEVKLYALSDYSVTVKLPDGNPAQDVKVTFKNSIAGTFTAITGADGVATITAKLPPMVTKTDGSIGTGGSYSITIELSEELNANYAYLGGYISVDAATSSKEISLTQASTYTLTLTYKDGEETKFVEAGTQVTIWHYYNGNEVDDTTVEVGENGVATFKAVSTEYYGFRIENYVTTDSISANPTDFNIAVTCYKVQGQLVKGVLSKEGFANETTLTLGENTVYREGNYSYVKFVADKEGVYTLNVSPISMETGSYINFMFKDNNTSTYIMRFNKSNNTYDTSIITLNDEDKAPSGSYGYSKVQIKLNAGQQIIFCCSVNGYSCVDISYSEE